MRDTRSSSQILFGFLPDQTVDAQGGVWKVREWRSPQRLGTIDIKALSKVLRREAGPWRKKQMDGNFVSDLERGYSINVLALDRVNGVNLELYPKIWYCKKCKTLHRERTGQCSCAATGRRSQLHFVAFHGLCGTLREPRLPSCPQHFQAIINFPGTASARDISFSCSKCDWAQRGFPPTKCSCGGGLLNINVHRSSTVFTPQSVVIVNPPRQEDVQKIVEHGGAARALFWMISGMDEDSIKSIRPTPSSLRQQLINQGLPESVVKTMVDSAIKAGSLEPETMEIGVMSVERREEAEDQALDVALAASGSRRKIEDFVAATEPGSELGILYRSDYPSSLARAGLERVELIDKFPIFTGHYGYTRDGSDPEKSKLMTFKDRNGDYVVYGDLMETEAIFFRISALKVLNWLKGRGFDIPLCTDERTARIMIIQLSEIPNPGEKPEKPTIGSEVMNLIHSYCHRVIRFLAVKSGIERSSLSEYLVPLHLGFYVYASVRGDFILGGLQAVFESELNSLLEEIVHGESRCALDPGCSKVGGSCMACLHLGEPSCRYWNTFLTRHVLFDRNGYFRYLGSTSSKAS